MPVTVMISIGICSLLIGLNVLDFVVSIFMDAGIKPWLGFPLVRLMIDISIIKGLLERNDRIRRNSIMLDVLGLVFGTIILIFLIGASQQGGGQGLGVQTSILIGVFLLNIVLWIVDLVVLMQRSAREYCNQ